MESKDLTSPTGGSRSATRRLLSQAAPCWPHLVALALLGFVSVPLALLAPLPLKLAIDSVLGEQPLPRAVVAIAPEAATRTAGGVLGLCAALVLLLAVASHLQMLASSLLRSYATEKLTLGLRARLFPHVQRLALSFHDSRGTSDSIYRILYDTAAVPSLLLDGLLPFLSAVLTFAGMTYVVLRLSPVLALVTLAVAPFFLIVAVPFGRWLRREWSATKALASAVQAALHEVLGALRVVIAFGGEERERARLTNLAHGNLRANLRIALAKGLFDLLLGTIAAAGFAAVLYLGVLQVQEGVMTLGELLVVMFYLALVVGPLQTIVRTIGDVQASLVSVERVFSLLDEGPAVVERPDARPLERAVGKLEFAGVGFSYDPERPVLRDVSFSVEPGACIGIAGPTGAGKTTLVHLLTRLYDPTAGRILLDGVDVADYRLEDLRDQFAVVLQDALLFSATIAENIAYGRPDAGEAEIRAAAHRAGLDRFLESLPDGLRTLVGERGMSVSGGERQRVALARAFLKDAPILILDEPTSAVDVRTEEEILDAMDQVRRGRTTIIIAHRPSTLRLCDSVLSLEDGRISSMTAVAAR